MKELHNKFYKLLRQQGFRAHHCHKIERRAREVVKATKKNKGKKPVLRKLTARLDYQDYKLDLDNKVLRIAVLNDEWARKILSDSCHYISRRIVEIAREYSALIVLEDLNKLRNRANGSRRFNKKLSLWTYRRIQSYIHYKTLMEGLPVIHVDPRNTSRTSPLGGELSSLIIDGLNYPTDTLLLGILLPRGT